MYQTLCIRVGSQDPMEFVLVCWGLSEIVYIIPLLSLKVHMHKDTLATSEPCFFTNLIHQFFSVAVWAEMMYQWELTRRLANNTILWYCLELLDQIALKKKPCSVSDTILGTCLHFVTQMYDSFGWDNLFGEMYLYMGIIMGSFWAFGYWTLNDSKVYVITWYLY
jgi:hypothetical protein